MSGATNRPATGDESASGMDPLGPIIESFLARYRAGERPSITEYVERYPGQAEEIREVLPALVEIEQLVPGATRDTTAPRGGAIRRPDRGPGPLPGRLGDYRILRELGRGGMGVVYEAVRESLHNHVALKVMHAGFRSDVNYLRRFHIEARSAARLHHTNIVSVFDFGEHDGVCFYAMQYIAGHGLDVVLDDVRRLRSGKEGADPGAATRPQGDGPGARLAPDGAGTPASRAGAASPLPGRCAGSGTGTVGAEAAEFADGSTLPDRRSAAATGGPVGTQDIVAATSGVSALTGHPQDRYAREVARLMAQAADALAYAHKRGVIHRDIKPSNLLLDALGNLWLTDFGLAKFAEGADLSQSQDLVGTLRYMAPERLRGVSDRCGDIYALGATLYELLTLRPAFVGKDQLQLIDRIVHEPPTPPRQIDRRISPDLETIVLKALAKDPADRFSTADEMADELRLFVDYRPIRSRPVPWSDRLWRWARRNPVQSALVAVAASLTIALAAVSTAAALSYRRESARLEKEQGLTKRAERQARLAVGGTLKLIEAENIQRSGLMGQRFDSLAGLAESAKVLGDDPEGRARLPEIRDRAIHSLGLADFRLRVHRKQEGGALAWFDDDLERVAAVDRDGELVIRDVADGRERARLSDPEAGARPEVVAMGFGPGGETPAAMGRRPDGGFLLRIWDRARAEPIARLEASAAYFCHHPSGQGIFYLDPDGRIALWDRDLGRVTRRLATGFPVLFWRADPAGRRVALANGDDQPRIRVIDAGSGVPLGEWASNVGARELAWSADGKLLASGGSPADPRIHVWDVGSGRLTSVLQGHTDNITNLQFAHSGYLLASTSWDSTTRLWDAVSGEPLLLTPGLMQKFSADDRRVAFVSGKTPLEVDVRDLAYGMECITLHPGLQGNRTEPPADHRQNGADLSPDGRLLATCDPTGVFLWEASRGRELARLETGDCMSAIFQPDGRALITLGGRGVFRWPIRQDPGAGRDALRVGPPELLRESRGGEYYATWLPDGTTLAVAELRSAEVILLDTSQPHPARARHDSLEMGGDVSMRSVAVSPDGRWIAVGGWRSWGIRVWDLTNRRFRTLRRPGADGDDSAQVAFSPDGLSLVSSQFGLGYESWKVGSWEHEPNSRVPMERAGVNSRAAVFTPDGRLMARMIAPDQIQLVSPVTGRELARLTTPHPISPQPVAIARDGTRLVAVTSRNTVLVWDLRLIRSELVPLALDWESPSYPEMTVGPTETKVGAIPPPRPVKVEGAVIETKARRQAERAAMDLKLLVDPNDVEARVHRGWLAILEGNISDALGDLGHPLLAGNPEVDGMLTQVCEWSNRLFDMKNILDRRLRLAPDDADARNHRGLLALEFGRFAPALDDFDRFIAANRNSDWQRNARVRALIGLGRGREAIEAIDTLIPKYPADSLLFTLRASAWSSLGDLARASSDAEAARRLLPSNPDELSRDAWRYAAGPLCRRDPERAVILARRALELAPGNPMFVNTLGLALFRTARYDEARVLLERDDGAGAWAAHAEFILSMAHARLGHRDAARDHLRKALRRMDEAKELAPDRIVELSAYRIEAEAVLAEPESELPANVFVEE